MRVWFIFNWLRGDDNKLYEIELGKKIRTLFCLQTAKKSIFPVLRKTNLHSPADHDEYDYCGWSYVAKYVNFRPDVLYNHPAKPLILLTMMLSK